MAEQFSTQQRSIKRGVVERDHGRCRSRRYRRVAPAPPALTRAGVSVNQYCGVRISRTSHRILASAHVARRTAAIFQTAPTPMAPAPVSPRARVAQRLSSVSCRRSKSSGLIACRAPAFNASAPPFHAGECRHNQNRNGGIERFNLLSAWRYRPSPPYAHRTVPFKAYLLTHLSQRIMPTVARATL